MYEIALNIINTAVSEYINYMKGNHMKELKAKFSSLLNIVAQLLLPEVPAAFHSNGPRWAKYVFPSSSSFPLHLAAPIQRASDQGGSDPLLRYCTGWQVAQEMNSICMLCESRHCDYVLGVTFFKFHSHPVLQ